MDANAPRIVLVEDDPTLRKAVAGELRSAGYLVREAADGRGFEELLDEFRPDLALLDVMLPGRSGRTLAAAVRARSTVGIVFLTARDSVQDRLAGFESGADDYLVKPFAMAELLARIRALLRRSGHLGAGKVAVGDLLVDIDSGDVLRAGQPVSLTATELRVLAFLAQNRGRVLSKTQILTQVWGYDAYDPNLVEAYVSTLRRKLEATGPRVIHTVRGIGYRLNVPSHQTSHEQTHRNARLASGAVS